MIKLVKLAAATGLAIAVSGCSTITFTNGNAPSDEQYSEWHHNLAFSLYEYSEPVTPKAHCANGWSSITVEKDIVTAIAGSIDNSIIDIWDPWAVDVTCAK